jgi:hypothetical protein
MSDRDSSATWPTLGHDVPQLLSDFGKGALSLQPQGKPVNLRALLGYWAPMAARV